MKWTLLLRDNEKPLFELIDLKGLLDDHCRVHHSYLKLNLSNIGPGTKISFRIRLGSKTNMEGLDNILNEKILYRIIVLGVKDDGQIEELTAKPFAFSRIPRSASEIHNKRLNAILSEIWGGEIKLKEKELNLDRKRIISLVMDPSIVEEDSLEMISLEIRDIKFTEETIKRETVGKKRSRKETPALSNKASRYCDQSFYPPSLFSTLHLPAVHVLNFYDGSLYHVPDEAGEESIDYNTETEFDEQFLDQITDVEFGEQFLDYIPDIGVDEDFLGEILDIKFGEDLCPEIDQRYYLNPDLTFDCLN